MLNQCAPLSHPDLDLCMTSFLRLHLTSQRRTSLSTFTSQVCHSAAENHKVPYGRLTLWFLRWFFFSTRHRVPAAAVLQEEVLQRAAAPPQKLHHVQQPGAVRQRRGGRLLLGLQHHADQSLENWCAGRREAGWPAAQRLHRLLWQQGRQTADILGQLPGEDERQRSLNCCQSGEFLFLLLINSCFLYSMESPSWQRFINNAT